MQRLSHSIPCLPAVAPPCEDLEGVPGPARSWSTPSPLLLCNLELQHCLCPSGGQACLLTLQTGSQLQRGLWEPGEQGGLRSSVSPSEAPSVSGCGVTWGEELATGE